MVCKEGPQGSSEPSTHFTEEEIEQRSDVVKDTVNDGCVDLGRLCPL